MPAYPPLRSAVHALLVAIAWLLAPATCLASEFSVSPVRVELKPGALTETVTVINHSPVRLRVQVRLMAWSQDEKGADVYTESGDIIYFPRQMDMEGESRKLIRVGAKSPAALTERTYRLFIEELPEAKTESQGSAQVSVYFRFGVPVFLPPAVPRIQADVGEPTLDKGTVAVQVRNAGNQHVRIMKVVVSDGAGHQQEVSGWYALAGAQRTYTLNIPPDICRKSKTLHVTVEGEALRVNRKLDVDPARCV